jgi:hypothetical protein
MENILEKTVVNIFNIIQKYVAENVIPEMIETFKQNEVEIDEDSLLQFFPDVKSYNEISKYFNKNEYQLQKQRISNIVSTDENICDYVFVKGEKKGQKCNTKSEYEKDGHPRCSKHKNNVVKESDAYSKNIKQNKTKSSKTSINDSKNSHNKTDIQTLLAKIKAAKEKQQQ